MPGATVRYIPCCPLVSEVPATAHLPCRRSPVLVVLQLPARPARAAHCSGAQPPAHRPRARGGHGHNRGARWVWQYGRIVSVGTGVAYVLVQVNTAGGRVCPTVAGKNAPWSAPLCCALRRLQPFLASHVSLQAATSRPPCWSRPSRTRPSAPSSAKRACDSTWCVAMWGCWGWVRCALGD